VKTLKDIKLNIIFNHFNSKLVCNEFTLIEESYIFNRSISASEVRTLYTSFLFLYGLKKFKYR